MARAIDADDFKKFLQALCDAGAPHEDVIRLLDKQPTIDTMKHGYVPSEVLDQIRWERDIAMSYLEEAGVGFGEKAELQRVKHGKWIISSDGYYPYCSECHYRPEKHMTNYCPDCGARMDGE